MASPSSSINYKQAAQAAAFAVAYQILCPENALSTISTIALAEIGCFGIDLVSKGYQLAKETQCFYKLLYQDLQKLLDDADAYQEYLEMAPTLVSEEQIPLSPLQKEKLNGIFAMPNEILEIIFSRLPIEDIVHFAGSSKWCYLATKTDSVWKSQLNKLFPEVKCLSQEEYRLTPQQQVETIYRRTGWLLKLCNEQYKKNGELIEKLCKPPYNPWPFPGGNFNGIKLYQLVGDHYDGTDESIDSLSKQGVIIECINGLKKDCETFAKPEEFTKYMQRARSALDIQKRLKDFPQRVNKMKELVDKDVFTDLFVRTTIESRCYEYPLQIFVYTEVFAIKTAETIRKVLGSHIPNMAKSRLDQMLRFNHCSMHCERLPRTYKI